MTLLVLVALPARIQAQPSSYHDVVFARRTGAVVLREGSTLRHVAADGTVQQLPAFPLEGRIHLLTLGAGLWVRAETVFGYFRPGADGWTTGKWWTQRPFSAQQLRDGQLLYLHEDSPVLVEASGNRQRLRVNQVGIAHIEYQSEWLHERDEAWRRQAPRPAETEVRYDAAAQRCIVVRPPAAGGAMRVLPGDASECDAEVETSSGRLWLRYRGQLMAEQGDGWWTLKRLQEPPDPNDLRAPDWSRRFDRAAPLLGGLAVGALGVSAAFATPESWHGNAIVRSFSGAVASVPCVLVLDQLKHPGRHDASVILLPPLALLLSPLPAVANGLAGRLGDDHAQRRGRGIGAAYGATLLAAALVYPLTSLVADHDQPERLLLATLLEVAVIGFASSVAYNYAADLD